MNISGIPVGTWTIGTVLSGLTLSVGLLQGQSTPPPASAERAGFGAAVAATEGTVFIGEAATQRSAGRVYVYRMVEEGDGWEEAGRLAASDGDVQDGFGSALAADGETLAVGASGAVYVFARQSDGEWLEVAKLPASDPQARTGFGGSLALAGEHLLVGAPLTNRQTGTVHAFRRTDQGWVSAGVLPTAGLRPTSRFGAAIAAAGTQALVGAPLVSGATGAVFRYRYDTDSAAWVASGQLEPEALDRNHRFGSAVDMVEGFAVVGAPRYDGSTGAVFPFAFNPGSGQWRPMEPVQAFDRTAGSGFGSALALGETTLWVGAPGAYGRAGALYGIEWDDDLRRWSRARIVARSRPDRGDAYGGSVAAAGMVAVAGIVRDDYGEGSAVILDADPLGWDLTPVVGETDGLEAVTGDEVRCEDGSAALFDCQDVDLVAFVPVTELGGSRGVRVNDIWGWTDPETGKEWVLVGRTEGTAFVDVSDPGQPRFVGEMFKPEQASGSVWRDIKVYRNHAFVVSDGAGPHGMQVFDLTRLREAESGEPRVYEADAHYDRIASAHNIVIDTVSGFAYSVGSSSGGETCGGGLHMIDIRNPTDPQFAGCFADPQTGRASTGYTHDAQCVTYAGPDTEHEGRQICFGANETALSIADVTDKTNPIALSRAGYPNVGYSHQGWLTDDHRYFLLNDELDELQGGAEFTRTLVWDVSDLDDPQMIKEHMGTQKSSDHNLYVLGDHVYQSNYVSGLRVLDISDVANPVEVAYFDTVPWGENDPGFDGSWSNYPFFKSGIVAVTSGREGLFLLRKRPTGRPIS